MSEDRTARRCEKDILAAKKVLIAQRHMTEPQAHRYLQKTSMDTGRSVTETARMVLLLFSA